MNRLNRNDYVIVNGKKFYAMGGITEGPDDPEDGTPPEVNASDFYDEKNNPNGVYYFDNHSGIKTVSRSNQETNPGKQPPHGHNLFMDLRSTKNDDEDMSPREQALRGRRVIYNWLDKQSKIDPDIAKKIQERGIDLKKYNDDTNNPDVFNEEKNTYTIDNKETGHRKYKIDFDDKNSQLITKLFAESNPEIFEYDNSSINNSEKSNLIFSGPQVVRATRGLYYETNPFNKAVKSEREIIDKTIKDNFGTDVTQAYRAEFKNGNKLYTLYTSDGNRRDVLLTKSGKIWGVQYDGETSGEGTTGKIKAYVPLSEGHINHISKANGIVKPIAVRGNSTGFRTKKVYDSLGGRTTRLYAVGGLTGEQIPIGEQPEDYNMVGAGGSHEQNPMGGVPYGVNQDGSQNMVEEGEVSVGNNVFSDRTAISPELCQQLGLPEGTSPAQAMQQIEALYEQGQIGDEEFQEIQQIIFEDQEAQKQNVGQSYQQGEVGGGGVPQEGITTDMMQGSSMPPEAMQGGMQPMPQQGAPMPQTEGITPDMVQGGMYGCGGRMRRW